MTRLPMVLAQVSLDDLPATKTVPGEMDIYIVVGAVVLIVLLALVWVIVLRKPRRHHRHHHYHSSSRTPGMSPQAGVDNPSEDGDKPGESRRRRRRREHRKRNPTLAETGGLPPIRGDKPTDGTPA